MVEIEHWALRIALRKAVERVEEVFNGPPTLQNSNEKYLDFYLQARAALRALEREEELTVVASLCRDERAAGR